MRLPLCTHQFIMSHCCSSSEEQPGCPPGSQLQQEIRLWDNGHGSQRMISILTFLSCHKRVKCLYSHWVDKLKYLCCSFKLVVVLNHNGHEFPQSTEIKVSPAPQTRHFSTLLSSNQHSWPPRRLLNHSSPGHITACFEQSFNKHSSQGICAGLQLCLLWFLWICQGGWGTKHRLASFPVSHRASLLLQCERRPVGGSVDARLPAAGSVSVCEDKATPRGSSCVCI